MTTRRTFTFGLLFLGAGAWLASPCPALAAKSQKNGKRRRPTARRRAPAPADPNDPVGKLTTIYNRAMKDVDGRVVTLSLAKDDRKSQFSSALADLWDKADAKPKRSAEEGDPIDFDPVTNSQGLTVKTFTVVTEKEDENRATLAVTIKADVPRDTPAENVIRYDFVREDGRWKIDDIKSVMGGKPWSIVQVLTKYVEK